MCDCRCERLSVRPLQFNKATPYTPAPFAPQHYPSVSLRLVQLMEFPDYLGAIAGSQFGLDSFPFSGCNSIFVSASTLPRPRPWVSVALSSCLMRPPLLCAYSGHASGWCPPCGHGRNVVAQSHRLGNVASTRHACELRGAIPSLSPHLRSLIAAQHMWVT